MYGIYEPLCTIGVLGAFTNYHAEVDGSGNGDVGAHEHEDEHNFLSSVERLKSIEWIYGHISLGYII